MRRRLGIFLTLALAALLLSGAAAADFESFTDVEGHWAAETLSRAVSDGYLVGSGDKLDPDGSVNRAQAAAIINRTLNAQIIKAQGEAWYAADMETAAALGYIAPCSDTQAQKSLTRGEVFVILARAYSLTRAAADEEALAAFSDAAALSGETRRAAGSLIARGIVAGSGGKLNTESHVTRAEFISLVYRVADAYSIAELSAERVTVKAGESAVLRAGRLQALSASGAVENLAVAADGDLSIYIQSAKSLILSGDGGTARLSGSFDTLDITGSRAVNLGGSYNEIAVSAAECEINIPYGVRVGTLRILPCAVGARVTLNGSVDTLTVEADNCDIAGSGSVKDGQMLASRGYISVRPNGYSAFGGTKIILTAPESIPDGEKVRAEVTFENAPYNRITVAAQWHTNLIPEQNAKNAAFELSREASSTLTPEIPFPKAGEESAQIGFSLCYAAAGAFEYRYAGADVALDNYLNSGYYAAVAAHIQSLVTTYQYPTSVLYDSYIYSDSALKNQIGLVARGTAAQCISYYGLSAAQIRLSDGSTGWVAYRSIVRAKENYTREADYTQAEKELWIEVRGYESETDYLVWVSLSCQKVNIFTSTGDSWALYRVLDCATGANDTATPVGVYDINYHMEAWVYDTYRCGPITGFFGNYAFHSWLHTPAGGEFDYTIGRPVSHGCIRLTDEGAQYMYTLPMKTRVIVF